MQLELVGLWWCMVHDFLAPCNESCFVQTGLSSCSLHELVLGSSLALPEYVPPPKVSHPLYLIRPSQIDFMFLRSGRVSFFENQEKNN